MDDSKGSGKDSGRRVQLAPVRDDTRDDDSDGGNKADSGCENGTEDSGCSDDEGSGCRN